MGQSIAVQAPVSGNVIETQVEAGGETRHFERTLARLIDEIPRGLDVTLDEYRDSEVGDVGYSTSINRQVRAFLLYRKYVETGSRILDWGCRHALDSCMTRMVNPDATIEGCDVGPSMVAATRQFARMGYTQLTHPWKMPYADAAFDRVISAGVLEHAPVSTATLQELHRIIEDGGYLFVTFLPNRLSYTEFVMRRFLKSGHHTRRYSVSRVKRLLEDHGFEPIETGYHQLLPSLTVGHNALRWPWMGRFFRALFKFDPVVERLWPFKFFCANIYAVAIRRECM